MNFHKAIVLTGSEPDRVSMIYIDSDKRTCYARNLTGIRLYDRNRITAISRNETEGFIMEPMEIACVAII